MGGRVYVIVRCERACVSRMKCKNVEVGGHCAACMPACRLRSAAHPHLCDVVKHDGVTVQRAGGEEGYIPLGQQHITLPRPLRAPSVPQR
jgi:hypothetical protein